MTSEPGNDPFLEEEKEEAEKAEIEGDSSRSLLAEREAAEGVELFENEEAALAASAIREQEPGRESMTGDTLALQPEDEEEPEAGL